MPEPTCVMTASAIRRAIARIAHEIAERNDEHRDVIIVGVQRGGVQVAQRLASFLEGIWKIPIPLGRVDVSMHRDDLSQRLAPDIQPTNIPADITGKTVVLVDDVLFQGRTVRAAMDALNDFGRPNSVQLAVLVDRGHRQLPITPDFVGKTLPTSLDQKVEVRLANGDDSVNLTNR